MAAADNSHQQLVRRRQQRTGRSEPWNAGLLALCTAAALQPIPHIHHPVNLISTPGGYAGAACGRGARRSERSNEAAAAAAVCSEQLQALRRPARTASYRARHLAGCAAAAERQQEASEQCDGCHCSPNLALEGHLDGYGAAVCTPKPCKPLWSRCLASWAPTFRDGE